MKLALIPFMLIGLALIATSVWWGNRALELSNNGIVVSGTVVENLSERQSGSNRRNSYIQFALIEFPTDPDQPQRVKIAAELKLNESVELIYLPENPEGAVIHSTKGIWGGPLFVLFFGVMFTSMPLLVMWMIRR